MTDSRHSQIRVGTRRSRWLLLVASALAAAGFDAFGQAAEKKSEPVAKSAAPATAKPADKPAEKAAEKPADKPAEKASPAEPTKGAPATNAPASPESDAESEAAAKAADAKLRSSKPKTVAKPKKKAPIDSLIEKPGAERLRLPFFEGKDRSGEAPAIVDSQAFESMRRGQTPANKGIIDRNAKHLVLRLTKPDQRENMSKLAADIVRYAKPAPGASNVQGFLAAYRSAATKYLGELIADSSLFVRINALLVLSQFCEDGFNDPVKVFVATLEDTKQPDATVYLALKGIDAAKANRLVDVEDERRAVEAIFNRLEKETPQSVLFEQMVETLGQMGRAFRSNVPQKAGVGTFLADVALDPRRSTRVRFTAALALARLKSGEVSSWNAELQGVVIARALKQLIAEKDSKQVGEERLKLWIDDLSASPAFAAERGKLGDLALVVRDLRASVFKSAVDLDASKLDDWLAKKGSVKSRKLADAAEELKNLDEATKAEGNAAAK